MWEDDQCKDGGKWGMRISKTHSNKYWEDLLLALIGDQFTDENEVNGIMISLRHNVDTLQIWNKSGKDQAKIETLKKDIENIIQLDISGEPNMKLEYENFQEAI